MVLGWHLWVWGVTYGSAPHLPTADGSFGLQLLQCLTLNLLYICGWRATYVSGMALMGPGWHLWVWGVTYGSAPHLPTADGSFGPRLLELCNRGLLLMGLGGHL